MARYVGQCLMAVLSTFNERLRHRDVILEEKLQILKSLNDLILLLGPEQLAGRKHAVLECVKMAGSLGEGEVQGTAVLLWHSLVHSLTIESLEDVLPQVLVGLLPHLSSSPAQTAAIYKFLLIDHAKDFKEQEAPFLMLLDARSAPGMDRVVAAARGQDGDLQFRGQLKRLLIYLEHESVEVRLQTFRTLAGMLDQNMAALQGLLLCSERADPVVTAVVQACMSALSCREPEQDTRLLAAGCLGKIGAIDPGRMEWVVEQEREHGSAVLDLFSEHFCISFLNELVRAQGSCREPGLAEVFSYSLQEVLKVYEINLERSGPQSFSWRVWRGLISPTQEMLAPLLDSK